jgi:hypothetical protein
MGFRGIRLLPKGTRRKAETEEGYGRQERPGKESRLYPKAKHERVLQVFSRRNPTAVASNYNSTMRQHWRCCHSRYSVRGTKTSTMRPTSSLVCRRILPANANQGLPTLSLQPCLLCFALRPSRWFGGTASLTSRVRSADRTCIALRESGRPRSRVNLSRHKSRRSWMHTPPTPRTRAQPRKGLRHLADCEFVPFRSQALRKTIDATFHARRVTKFPPVCLRRRLPGHSDPQEQRTICACPGRGLNVLLNLPPCS